MIPAAAPAPRLPWALLGWIAFVVYGSLVPLNWQPLPWHEALDRLAAAPWHEFDVQQRADWVANGVLYAPLGLLLARQAIGQAALRWLPLVLAWGLALGLALAVELAQIAFPPRSVSRNDLLAEAIGAGVGVLAWPLLRFQLARWHDGWRQGGRPLAQALLGAFALALPLLSLFPFDFLVSAAEWQSKLESNRWGLVLAGDASGRRRLLLFVFEAALAAPLGAWALRRHRPGRSRAGWARGLVVGALFGMAIELGQLATATGMSQGLSVLSRAVGAAAGAALWQALDAPAWVAAWTSRLRRWRWPLGLAWLALLLVANGYGRMRWQGLEAAAAGAAGLSLVPFHYHYFTTEAIALASLVRVALAYAPLALLAAAFGRGPWASAVAGALLAAAVEGGKLLLAGARPDPTNLWIAATAAGLASLLLARLAAPADVRRSPPMGGVARATSATAPGWPAGAALAALAALLVWVAIQAASFPGAGPWLLPALAAAALAVAWRPTLSLTILPAALPLDLAMWSGRTLWDEFDLLLLAVVGVALWRTPPAAGNAAAWRDRKADGLAAALAFSLLVAAGVAAATSVAGPGMSAGWWGAPGAWRMLKGALGAAAALWLWQRLAADDARASRLFELGLGLAALIVAASVVWERLAFVSLLNTSAAYRVTGPFAAMLRGGAYLEAFLAVGWAFALARAWRTPSMWPRLAWAALAGAIGYALAVTWSRGGWWAGALVAAVMLVALWRAGRREPLATPRAGRRLAVAASALGLVAALPFLLSPLAGERLARWDEDLLARAEHWLDAWAIREPGPAALLVGSGLGAFAEAHYWRSREDRHAGGFAVVAEAGNRFLRLGKGEAIYVEQWVDLEPGLPVTVSLRLRAGPAAAGMGDAGRAWTPGARASAPGGDPLLEVDPALHRPSGAGALRIGICEKWMLTSLRCAKGTVRVASSEWGTQRIVMPTDMLAPAKRPLPRPLKFAVWLDGAATLDIDDLQIDGPGLAAPLANGSFERGWDHWLFATDVAPPWQIDNLALAVLWQQGLLGLAALAGLVALALWRGLHRLWAGDATAAAPVAAVVALLGLGSVSTLIDSPRFLWLLLVLLWWCGRRRSGWVPGAQPAL